ncbi:hypothetical protein B0H67DRAFT_612000 [Lasiosphaeris hirsuta]|uniref:Uncharacterized protein n=1 Tax=Lasiosphaeris hirsuta TaxID=260670 RepID=A0AA40AA78_9PEZI|nr:hypothetical protein B0H67DRAFT_612000 [Lasiosphaeris hirsuta]
MASNENISADALAPANESGVVEGHQLPTAATAQDAVINDNSAADEGEAVKTSESSCFEDGDYNFYIAGRLVEKWSPAMAAITKATSDAFADSPGVDCISDVAEFEAFQAYWYDIFTQLVDTVAADPAIPEFLGSPPANVKKFAIELFEEEAPGSCPCCLEDVEPTIVIESPTGVTKTDLVRGLRDYLYRLAPLINNAEGSLELMHGALVWNTNWMSSGTSAAGERLSYYTQNPKITVYCYPWSRYDEVREGAGAPHVCKSRVLTGTPILLKLFYMLHSASLSSQKPREGITANGIKKNPSQIQNTLTIINLNLT